ncbi:MAG TPA: transglycosylase SLT domain-containing protein [Terriglobia bacterium]|nr:transglycosylase SLT domain-containing protein [Terriglobia bacterium]
MRFPIKTFAGLGAALLLAAGAEARAPAQKAGDAPAQRLNQLVAGAQEKRGWPALRRFADSASTTDLRGQSYFALGYREFEGNEFSAATDDLKLAAATQFPLADYAEYYAALSALAEKQAPAAVDILDGFIFRHPESVLRLDALALFGEALIAAGQPARAVEALRGQPLVRQRPGLEYLLARAELSAGKLGDAARSFQDVYCTFPTTAQARAAGEELVKLRARMGAEYPAMSEELETTRAESLLHHLRYRESLKDLTALLKESPTGALAPKWKVDRAWCLLHLKEITAALDQLQSSFPNNPGADAERMEALVEAYAQHDNVESMDLMLDQLHKLYPQSPAYASALDVAGNHLVRKGDWQGAARYYSPLAQLFPDTSPGQEATWRVAWNYYLQKETAKARQAFVDHATRYPTSPHVPGDFYWLGRLAEAESGWTEARAFYSLVQTRWAQTYYAQAASRRLAGLQSRVTSQGGGEQTNSLANDLAQKIPPPPSPADTCAPTQPLPALRPFSMLASMGLDDLALQYLRTLVRERPASSALFISLSEFEAQKGQYNPSVLDAARAVPLFYDYPLSELPKETWILLYPTEYWTVVEQEARAHSVDPYLVMALIRQESAFDPGARSRANARGLMQILPGTARTRKGGRGQSAGRLYNASYNIKIGTDYLQHLLELNHGVYEQAMAAYHAGEERVSQWVSARAFSDPDEFLETIPIPATRVYVEKVVRDAVIYRKLMEGTGEFRKCG